MSLERKLQDTAEQWLAGETMSPEQAGRLEILVQRRAGRRRGVRLLAWGGAVAVGLVLALGASPGIRAWAGRNLPMIGQYIERWSRVDKGWAWAEAHGMFQEVLAEAYDNGYTFRVHQVLADPTRTTIIYTVEGQDAPRVGLSRLEVRFDGERMFPGVSLRDDVIDGVTVGSMEFNPIPAVSGELDLTLRRIGEVNGRWRVQFPVSRAALSEATRAVAAGQSYHMPTGTLMVDRLVLAPTQTVVELTFTGQPEGPDLDGTRLLTPDAELERRGGGSHGHRQEDGSWLQTYRLEFQRLDPLPASVNLALVGRIHHPGETRVPLTGDRTGVTPRGLPVTVTELALSGRTGSATIEMPADARDAPPLAFHEWHVLDDQGELHPTFPPGGRSASWAAQPATTGAGQPQIVRYEVAWKLPFGRTAVALVNAAYWEYTRIDDITIAIPAE